MKLFSRANKPDATNYPTGEDRRWQDSRAWTLAIIAYMGIFLFGYDTGVGGGVISMPSFQKDFRYENASAKVKADHGSNVVSLLHVGAFFGALTASFFMQRIGRRLTMMLSCFIFLVGGICSTVAMHTLGPMIAGRVICGFAVGIMSNVCPTFVSEMAPKAKRGTITGLFQVIVVIGVAFSYWIEYAINVSMAEGTPQWRIPIAFQLVPAGLMLLFLPFMRESPRWLAYRGRMEEAIANLAWTRKRNIDDPRVVEEFNEICAAIEEEKNSLAGASWGLAMKPGNRIRMFIGFAIFFLQQWSGQNSINYYAPDIFKSIGLTGTKTGLLSSGIYGIVKIVATSAFVLLGIEKIGRKWALGFGALGMSIFLWIIGAVFYTHPVDPHATSVAPASIAMAAMVYCFVIPYCFSWGPVPWVYCAEIFPMRLRPYGMSVATSTQWCFNFVLTKITPYLILDMPQGKIFFFFAAMNILSAVFGFWLPETSGISLEQMDVVFGAITQEERDANVARQTREREARGDGHLSAKEKDLEGDIEHREDMAKE